MESRLFDRKKEQLNNFFCLISQGSPPEKINVFFWALPELPLPPSPQFGQLVPLSLDVKNDVLAPITEPSNDDYDNGVSDNCDQNFGTFDDFVLKMTKKYHIT